MAKGGFRGMPGGMNQAAMMKQAQKMQQEMLRMQAEQEAKTFTAKAGGETGHIVGSFCVSSAHSFVDSSHDHVLQHLDIIGIHSLGIDLDANQLMLAVDSCSHHAAASLGGVGLGLHLLLHPQHLLLHLLGLLHHCSLIHTTGHTPETTFCHNSNLLI